ncbi:MAG: hypothetical protein WBW88_15460, partial [Rhodothermales bacterium]
SMLNHVVPILVAAIFFGSTPVAAQAPYAISHQGFVTDPGGTPINSAVSMVFKMYKGGVEVWSETHASVAIVDGVYSVLLGEITPFDTLAFDVPIELGVTIGADTETTPRTTLVAAPNALNLRNMRVHRRIGSYGETVNLIGGYDGNSDATGVELATISGGGWDLAPNRVQGSGGTIGGGSGNLVGGVHATVGGGGSNHATAEYATVAGGHQGRSTGESSTVGGGTFNKASGGSATVPGGAFNLAKGVGSFAAGVFAHASNDNSFVWSDGSGDSLVTTADNQFLVRAAGGVGIGTNTPDGALHVAKTTIGVSSGDVERDDIIVEDSDAILGLYSDDAGTWASGIVMGELNVLGLLEDKWAMVRETSGSGSSLYFRYGVDQDYLNATNILHLNPPSMAATHGSVTVEGNLGVVGSITKGSGTFKIDHPLDPTNKFLYHSFVESPDMMNVYNGNVVLDSAGAAMVQMPAYFEALNRDFRYQLTPIGGPGPDLYVADEITENTFRIAGGRPGMKVSWMVTGVRQDPYAEMNRVVVEVDKPEDQKGTYLYPEAYGKEHPGIARR